MTTIGSDKMLSPDKAAAKKIQLVTPDDIFKRSDIITFHVPLNSETSNMLNDDTIQLCKKGVYIINAARGGVVNESTLLKALESGHVAGAALDVYESEPPLKIQPLLNHLRVICTPHLGASTEEAQEKVAQEISLQMIDALEGRKTSGIVNAKILAELHARPELETWVDLTERLGDLQAQLLTGNLHQISIKTRGKLLQHGSKLLEAAALKGMLKRLVSQNVNFINAGPLAQERGLRIKHVHENLPSYWGNSVTVSFFTDRDSTGKTDTQGQLRRKFVGTVVNNNDARIVKVNDYTLEISPSGNMLFFTNKDNPGFIAKISSILANNDINIANFALGRISQGGDALGCLTIDSPISDELLKEIAGSLNFLSIQSAYLPEEDSLLKISSIDDRPELKPRIPNFSSGPTAKFPGFDLSLLNQNALGRSHRSTYCKRLIKQAIHMQRDLLKIPNDYDLLIVPGSDTGAYELTMWSLLSQEREILIFYILIVLVLVGIMILKMN